MGYAAVIVYLVENPLHYSVWPLPVVLGRDSVHSSNNGMNTEISEIRFFSMELFANGFHGQSALGHSVHFLAFKQTTTIIIKKRFVVPAQE